MRALFLILLLAGCSGGPLSLLTGGGPNVAANVQAGETNNQTLGSSQVRQVEQSVRRAEVVEQSADRNEVRTEVVEKLVIEKPIDPLWITAFMLWSIFLFWLPSPNQIGEALKRRLRRE